MNIEVLADAESLARRGAALIAASARQAVGARGRFLLAVSGGTTPRRMLELLADEQVPWEAVHVFQVDERLVVASSADRNLKHLREALLERAPVPAAHVHAMPVDDLMPDAHAPRTPTDAAAAYASELSRVAGAPATLDLVHLGLGSDGHTASLVPGDPALDVMDADVAVTRPYQGTQRMTLTFPALARARRIVWVVSGAGKRDVLTRFRAGDPQLPATRVPADHALVLADRAAAGA